MSNEILRVREITIKNFRTYYGERNPILFSTDIKKPVTVFHGINARGKTTLLNAIHWCIYGKEKSDLKIEKTTSEGLVHTFSIDQLKLGNTDEMFVKVIMENEKSEFTYEIERKIRFSKKNSDSKLVWNDIIKANTPKGIEAETEIRFRYFNPDKKETMGITDKSVIDEMLENIFPEILSSYLLFDAELLESFERNNAEELIKKGIETITGLPVVKNAKNNLKDISIQITSEEIKDSAEFDNSKSQLLELNDQIEKFEGAINEKNDIIKRNNAELNEIQKFLIESDEGTVKQIETEKQTLKSEIKKIDDEINTKNTQLKELIFDNFTDFFLKDTYQIVDKKLEKWTKIGKMPSFFSKEALNSLLHEEECVCTRKLNEENKEYREIIKKKIDTTFNSNTNEELSIIKNEIRRKVTLMTKEYQEDVLKRYENIQNEIALLRIETLNKQGRKKELEEIEIDKTLPDEITAKQVRQTELMRENNSLSKQIGELESKLNTYRPMRDEEEIEFEQLKKSKLKNDKALNEIKLTDFAKDIFNLSITELFNDFKSQIEKETNNYFMKIAPSADEFKEVKINDQNFTMVPIRSKNKEKSISKGQAHALGLSYVAAMRSIMKKNYFFMIDSPFHNISQESRLISCVEIPKNLGTTQVAFFVTDSEYRSSIIGDELGDEMQSIRSILKENDLIGAEYNLVDNYLGEIDGEKYRNTDVVRVDTK